MHFSMHYGMYNMVDGMNMISCMIKIMHNFTLCLIYLILVSVISLSYFMFKKKTYLKFNNNTSAELVWTIMPLLLLFAMGIPSFTLLYSMESKKHSDLTYKAIGHQWYWSYEGNDIIEHNIESYMNSNVDFGMNRLLEVDNKLLLPYNSTIQMIVTSEDVLHSWALPNLGTKIDAVPGRLNSIMVSSVYPGNFYGQCSEICGINHSFMPISVEFGSWKSFFMNLNN
uniref:Cytochrome c oxidase subunit 2 n=1 Tax=Didemnum vexillum TaxID=516032 RepID=A0A0A7LFM7_9ASCI|nr:cytochrome c oxidase subunit II [Didemnum vexillum]